MWGALRDEADEARVAGPLLRQDGTAIGGALATRNGELSCEDGSRLEWTDASLELVHNEAHEVRTLLEEGHIDFSIEPGGPRRWIVECGLARVEVVGTEFSIDRSPDSVRVSVGRGVVLVHSIHLEQGLERLGAGGELTVRRPVVAARPTEVEGPSDIDDLPSGTGDLPSDVEDGTHEPESAPGGNRQRSWRSLAREGGFDSAFDVLGAQGVARETRRSRSCDRLWELADVARLSGHPRESVGPLERIVSDYADDSRTPLAAFTLARVYLSLGQKRRAAQRFARARALGLPRNLDEDAYAREVRAWLDSGRRAQAERAAESYRERYPNGTHRASMLRWLGEEP